MVDDSGSVLCHDPDVVELLCRKQARQWPYVPRQGGNRIGGPWLILEHSGFTTYRRVAVRRLHNSDPGTTWLVCSLPTTSTQSCREPLVLVCHLTSGQGGPQRSQQPADQTGLQGGADQSRSGTPHVKERQPGQQDRHGARDEACPVPSAPLLFPQKQSSAGCYRAQS
jgi:hypothetical protein